MSKRTEKVDQIVEFVRNHPQSLASRTVLRRMVGTDYEIGEELFVDLEQNLGKENLNDYEVDCCYDLIK